MPVTRECPKCGSKVHIRKLVHQHGNVFRKSKPVTATLEARKHYAVSTGEKRSAGTEEQATKCRIGGIKKDCAARNRTLETAEQADVRRKLERDPSARNRALERAEQADVRRKLERDHFARNKSKETAE